MFNTSKLKTSALIALGGLLISVIPFMADNLIEVISEGAVFDWEVPIIMTITAVSTWLVATLRNYMQAK